MMTLRRFRHRIATLMFVLTACWQITQPLQAVTIYWDGSASGSWNASTNWNTLPDGTGADIAVGAGNDLVFTTSAGALNFSQTVDTGVALAVNSLLFNSSSLSPITIATGTAGSLISLGAGGLTMDAGAAAVTISAPITLTASQAWTNNSSSLLTASGALIPTGTWTFGGSGNFLISGTTPASNTTAITKNGTGTLEWTSDPNTNGNLTINDGVVFFNLTSTAASDMTNIAVNNTSTLRVAGGAGLSANSIITLAAGATYDNRFSDTIAQLLGSGTLTNGAASGTVTTTLSSTTNATFSGVIQDGATAFSAIAKSNTNNVTLTGDNTYTGATTINTSLLEVSGSAGSIRGSTIVNVGDFNNSTATTDSLVIGQNANVVAGALNRLADTATVSLRGAATVTINGPAAGSGGFTETIGVLDANAGRGVLTLNPAAGQELQLTVAGATPLTRSNQGTLLVRGTGLGLTAGTADSSRVVFTTAPSGTNFVGGAGADGSTTVSIIPWMIGDATSAGAGTGFLTHHATDGLRLLTAGEYDSTIAGSTVARNVSVAGGETTTVDVSINSLRITGGTSTLNADLTMGSGAVLFTGMGTLTGTGRLDFGTTQGLITSAANTTAITGTLNAKMTGTAGLLISSSGNVQNIVQLGGETTLTGGIRVQNGAILQLEAASPGALNDNAPNSITLDTAGATLRLNGNSIAVGNLNTLAGGSTYSRLGVVENANATSVTLTVFQTSAQNFEGTLQNGTGGGLLSLIKSGASTWTLNNSSTYTGTTEIRQGNITLTGNGTGGGRLASSPNITLSSGGSLTLAHGTTNTADRILNAAILQMRGGTLTQNSSGNNNQSETIGALQIQSGSNAVSSGQAGTANTQFLTFASWARTAGAVVNFSGTGVGTTAQRNRVIFTASPAGILNDTVLAGATVGNELATYALDVDTGTAGNQSSIAPISAYDTGAATGWSATINAKPSAAQTLATDTSVNGLVLNAVGLNLGGNRLNVDTGMIITTGAAALISNGTLTAGNAGVGELILKVDTGTTQDFNSTNVFIDNNGANAVALTVHGAGALILQPGSTYTGATSILGTTTSISADSALGIAPSVAALGHLKIYGATLNVTNNMTLDANRGIEIGGGTSIISVAAGTGTNGRTLTYNGSITSTGNSSLTFQSNATSTNTDAGEFTGTLTGTLNLGGNFRLEAGTLTAPSATNVIGRSFQIGVNGTASYTQAGGSLKVGAGLAGDTFDVGVSGSDTINKAGTLNLSGVTNFTANVDLVRLGVVSGGSTSAAQAAVTLAMNNEITAITSFILGNSGGAGLGTQTLTFGAGTNSVTTPLVVLGGQKSSTVNTLPAGGTLTIQGFRERHTDLFLGRQNVNTSGYGIHTLDLNGTFNASLNSLQLGIKSGGGNGGADATMNLSANSHNIEATTVTLGSINGAANTSTTLGKGTLNMAGGTLAVVSDLSLGLFVGTTGTARGDLNLTGGTVLVGGNVVKTDSDRSSGIITINGSTAVLDLQNQAAGDTTAGTLTASQLNWQLGSLTDVASITLDGRGVTNGNTFAGLDNALVIRDFTIAVPLSFTGTTPGKGGILYENDNAGAGAVISNTLDLGSVQRSINVEDNVSVANDLSLTGALTSAGGMVKSGAGTLLLANSASTYAGNTAVENGSLILASGLSDRLGTTGTLTLGAGSTSGLLQLGDSSGLSNQTVTALATSGSGTTNAIVGGFTANSTLTVNQSTNTTYAGNLGGAGTNQNNLNLVKSGAGELILSGASTYIGSTNVSGGKLFIDSIAGFPATNNTSLTVADGSEFSLRGTGLTSNQTYGFAGAGNVITLGTGTGTATLGFRLDGSFNTQLLLAAGQTMSVAAGTTLQTAVYVDDAPNAGQGYILINGTDANSLHAGGGTFNPNPVVFNGGSFTYALTNQTLGGTVDRWVITPTAQAAAAEVWWKGDLTGIGTGVWSASTTSGTGFPTNWDDSQAGGIDALVPPDSGSHVHFSANSAANFTTTLGANLTVKQVTFESGSVTNAVTVGGVHTLTLGATGAGNIGFTLASGNAGTLQMTTAVALGQSQTWNVEDASGILRLSGGIGGTGSLTLNGSGTATGSYLIDTTSATYTGATNLNAGRLTLDGVNRLPTASSLTLGSGTTSGVLQLGTALATANTTLGGLATSGTGTTNAIVGANATVSILTVNQAANTNFDGILGGIGTNENLLALTKQGIGTLILNGANTYTGSTTVNNGTLQLGALGSITGTATLAISANAGAAAALDVNSRTISVTGNITLGGADSTAAPSILDTGGTGLLTLGGTTITYDATNTPLGGTIAVDMLGTGASRTIIGNDSSSAATDLTVSGDFVTTSNNSLTLDGTGNNLFSGNITSDSLAETTRDLNKAGVGTWTLSGSVNLGDVLAINGGTLNINGTTRQNDLIATGNVITNISGVVNGSLVADTASNGIYTRTGAVTNILANNVIGSDIDLVLVNDNAAGTSTLNVNTFNIATPRLDVGGASNTADRIGNVTGTGTITIGTVVNAYAGLVSANLATVSTGNVINKDSVGTITLSGINSLANSTSTIREGGLTLDFTTNAGTDNKIGTGALTMGSTLGEANPTLTLIGHATTASEQTVASIAVARGATQIILDGNGAGLTLDVTGAIARSNAATVNFSIEAGTQINAGTTTLTAEGIIGSWATVNKSSFATIATGQIAALTATAGNDPHVWTAGQNVINTGAFTHIVDGCSPDIATLTLNAATAATLTIDSNKSLNITSGGILVTSNVGANDTLITGGSLTSNLAGNGLIIHQNNTLGLLEIASTRVSGSLTKSGEGTLVLSGTSIGTTGTFTLNEGSVILTGGNAIGDGVDVNIQGAVGSGATVLELASGQTEAFRQLLGGENSNGIVQINLGATLSINHTDGDGTADENLAFGGNISGAGSLIKTGNDRLNLTGVSTHTGTLTINQGGVHASGALGRIASPTIIVNGAGYLITNQDQTGSIDRLLNGGTITLNNTNTGATSNNQGLWLLTNQGGTRTDTIGTVTLGAGHNTITASASAGGGVGDLSGTTLTRTGRSTALVRGTALGTATVTQRGQIRFSTAPTGSVGGGGALGSQNISVIPYLVGDLSATGLGNSFVTNTGATNGLRPLAAGEYTTDTAGFDALPAATLSNNNLRFATAGATALSGTATGVNSLVLDNAAAIALTGPANSFEITSGAILAAGAGNHSVTGWSAITTGGSRDYTVYVTTPAATLTVDSALTTAVPLVKSGAGALVLANAGNLFTDLYLNQGTVQADTLAKLGSGSLNYFGGTLRLAAGFAEDISTKTVNIGTGGGTLDVSLVTANSGVVTLANGLDDSTAGSNDSLTLITRSAAGAGQLVIQGTSTFTGTTIFNHTLVNSQIDNSIILNGATNATISGNIHLGNTGTITNNDFDVVLALGASEQIINTASITFRGSSGESSYFKLMGFTETVAGIADNTGFGIIQNLADTETVLTNGKLIVNSSADFSYNGFMRNISGGVNTTVLEFEKQGAGTQTLSGANIEHTGTTTITGGTLQLIDVTDWQSAIVNNAALSLNQTGVTTRTHGQDISGSGSVTKLGTGTVTLGGTNTYSGQTRMDQGVLSISSSANLGDASATNTLRLTNGATLQSTGANVDLTATRSITFAGTGGTLNVTGSNSLTVPGALIGDSCNTLTKSGTGMLVLTNASNGTTFAGGLTNVSAGVLQVGNAGVGTTGSGLLTVASGAVLAGTGTVVGDLLLNSGAVLHMGDVTTVGTTLTTITGLGTLNIAGNANLAAGSTIRFDVTNSVVHDLLSIGGNITLAGNIIVDPVTLSPLPGQVFNLIDWFGISNDFTGFNVGINGRTGADDNGFQFDLPDISLSGLVWDVSLFTVNGTISAVPEPTRALLFMLGLLALFMRSRRD